MIVKSPVKQNVRISSYTYYGKQFHGACLNDDALYTYNYLKNPKTGKLSEGDFGSYHLEPISMEAGEELEVHFYTDFYPDYLLPKDWSLVSWADSEAVTITHKGGYESAVIASAFYGSKSSGAT